MRALLIGLIGLLVCFQAVSEELKFKSVKPAKYLTGEPSKGFEFQSDEPHSKAAETPADYHLRTIRYAINDGTGRGIEGVLDTSGAKPKWAVEPRFKAVYPVNEHFSLAKPLLDGPYFVCKHGAGTCTEAGKAAAAYRNYGSAEGEDYIVSRTLGPAPYWSAPVLIGDWVDGYRANLSLYSPEGDVIGHLDNVAYSTTSNRSLFDGVFIQAIKMGDAAIIRTKDEARQTSDVALTWRGGEVIETLVPSFTIVHGTYRVPTQGVDPNGPEVPQRGNYTYMFTVEPGAELYFPVYPEGAGFRTAPEDLMGIRPLKAADHSGRGRDATRVQTIPASDADFYGQNSTAAWLAQWATPRGLLWAFVRTDEVLPTYEEIMASRERAAYVDVQYLWDTSLSARDARTTGLLDRYAFYREDGSIEVYRVGTMRKNLWPFVERDAQLAAGGLDGYFSREMAVEAAYRAEAQRNYDAMMAQQAANKIARDKAWAEYNARARQREQEAQARRAEQNRQAQLYWEEQERAAAANQQRLADQFAPDPSVAFWGAYSNSLQSSGPAAAPSAPVDYWKSYDSTNTTGQYTTSSGAATGCELGSGAC